jgi:hypothetical protein
VDLQSGEPIWISVAQGGVIVRKSRLGLLGTLLYREANVYKVAKTAEVLHSQLGRYTTPVDLNNPVLRAFTQVALDSESASQLSVRLNEAHSSPEKRPSVTEATPGEQRKRRRQIVADYGRYIEADPLSFVEIRDTNVLPHPKEEILDAILFEIVCTEDEDQLSALKTVALLLAEFQDGVGSQPVFKLGVSTTELETYRHADPTKLRDLAKRIAANSNQAAYDSLRELAEEDGKRILSKILAAELMRKGMPEKQKREVLG